MRELSTLRFVSEGSNVLLLGPPGMGKTHLAIALGMLAISQGISVMVDHDPLFTVADRSSNATPRRTG